MSMPTDPPYGDEEEDWGVSPGAAEDGYVDDWGSSDEPVAEPLSVPYDVDDGPRPG